MTEIKVIKTEKIALSEEEFIARIDDIAKLLNIPEYEKENFIELHKKALNDVDKNLVSDVLSVLVRKICTYNVVVPIILKPGAPYKDWKELSEFYGQKHNEFGPYKKVAYVGKEDAETNGGRVTKPPKSKSLKKTKPKKIVEKDVPKPYATLKPTTESVKTQEVQTGVSRTEHFNVETYIDFIKESIYLSSIQNKAADNLNKDLVGISNDSIKVVGLLIRHDVSFNKKIRDTFPWMKDILNRLLSGVYSSKELDDKIFIPFDSEQLDLPAKSVGSTHKHGTYNYVLFENEEQVKTIGGLLLKYLNMIDNMGRGFYIYNYLNVIRHFAENQDELTKIENTKRKEKLSELFLELTNHYVKFKESNVETKSVLELLKPPKELVEFSKDVEKVTNMTFSFVFESSIFSDMKFIKAYDLIKQFNYQSGDVHEKSKMLDDFLKDLSTKDGIEKQIKKNKAEQFSKYYIEMKFRWIYIKKFGIPKFNEYVKQLKFGKSSLRDVVPKKERELVEIEVERVEKWMNATRTNKCPHVEIERKMRNTVSMEKKLKYYNELEVYIPSKERHIQLGKSSLNSEDINISSADIKRISHESSFLKCTNCKLELICPHVRDQYELFKRHKSDIEINEFISLYAGDTTLSDAYYCQICGEKLKDASDIMTLTDFLETGVRREMTSGDDDLRDYVWMEVNIAVKSTVEFKSLQTKKDINKFVTSITETILELVRSIDKKLSKDKSSTEMVLSAKRKFLTSVYIYAVLIKIIHENTKKVTFTGKYAEKIKEGNIQNIFRAALNIILETQNVNIRQISGMTDELVKASLMQAYKNISDLLGASKIKPSEDDQITSYILDSAFYNYIMKMEFVSSNAPSSNLSDFKKQLSVSKKSSNVLHLPEVEIKSIDNPFKNVKMPKLPTSSDAFLKLLDRTERVKMNELPVLYDSYRTAAFEQILEYFDPKICLAPSEITEVLRDKMDETLFHKTITKNKDYEAFVKKNLKYRQCEDILFNLMHYSIMLPYTSSPFNKNMQFIPMKNPFPLLATTYGYEANTSMTNIPSELKPSKPPKSIFHIHIWNIHVYEVSDSQQKKEKIKKVIAKKLDLPYEERLQYTHIDKICSICFQLYSNIENIVKDPLKLMEEDRDVTNFYNYFYNRCPDPSKKQLQSGEALHEYTKNKDSNETKIEDHACLNCGITRETMESKDIVYYKKYVKVFDEFKKKSVSKKTEETSGKSYPVNQYKMGKRTVQFSKEANSLKSWKYNPNIVLQFANSTIDLIKKDLRLNKSEYFNILKNIGLVEGHVYEDIKSGKEDPSLSIGEKGNSKVAQKQISNIKSHIHDLFIEYYSIKNNKNLSVIPTHLKELLTPQLAKKAESFPEINDNFNEKYKGISELYGDKTHNYKISQYLLEYLLKKILDIIKLGPEVKDYASFLIGRIIEHERMVGMISDDKIAELNSMKVKTLFDDASMLDHTADNTMDDLISKDNIGQRYNYGEMDYNGINEEYNT